MAKPTQVLLSQVTKTVNRFRQNRAICKELCKLYGADCLFCIQPDPLYNYPLSLLRKEISEKEMYRRLKRELFHDLMKNDEDILYLGDLFKEFGVNEMNRVIINECHYSPHFNRFIAERVAFHIDLNKPDLREAELQALGATGAVRRASHFQTLKEFQKNKVIIAGEVDVENDGESH